MVKATSTVTALFVAFASSAIAAPAAELGKTLTSRSVGAPYSTYGAFGEDYDALAYKSFVFSL